MRPSVTITHYDRVVDAAVVGLYLAVAVLEATAGGLRLIELGPPVLAALAVALRRRATAAALGIVGLAIALQFRLNDGLSVVQLALLIVAYSATAYGSARLVRATGLAAAAAVVATTAWVIGTQSFAFFYSLAEIADRDPYLLNRVSLFWLLIVMSMALVVGWLLGLLRRVTLSMRQAAVDLAVAQADQERASAVAAAQEQKAQLAREVHDIVGHSLAVIIAQADSVRFRDPSAAFPSEITATVGTIADSARESLSMVRSVLARTIDNDSTEESEASDVAGLYERVRRAGLRVDVRHSGTPYDLPDPVRTTLFAVVRELMTNALHHADPADPVVVTQEWRTHELVLRTANTIGPATATPHRRGLGITNMRARLEAIGGGVDIQHSPPEHFLAVVRVPTDSSAVVEIGPS